MSRGSFGRTVARAAASGGSQSYRARRPKAWYLLMVAICVVGVGLVVYSRNEVLRPSPTAGPTATSNWYAAYAIDICGKIEPALPADSSTKLIGIRTFGDGLINISPNAALQNAANFEGAKATLSKFASSYPNFTLTGSSIKLPTKGAKTYTNGDTCSTTGGSGILGAGGLTIRVWASPTAKTATTETDPADIKLRNGQMITIGFVAPGTNIPQPPSKAALIKKLGLKSTSTSKK